MSERRDIPTGDALRALPLPTPPPGGWAMLAARRRARYRRRRFTLALAASLLVGIGIGASLRWIVPPPAADTSALLQLMRESAQLEATLAWTGVPVVDTGDSALFDQQLAQRLAFVDLQLADADAASAELLWAERVLLLRQRAQLAQARALLADGDGNAAASMLLSL
jgi:hypothetical protein